MMSQTLKWRHPQVKVEVGPCPRSCPVARHRPIKTGSGTSPTGLEPGRKAGTPACFST